MNILLINRSAYPVLGGVENSLRFMGRELLRKGHCVKIWCQQTDSSQPKRLVQDNLEIVRFAMPLYRWPHTRNFNTVLFVKREINKIFQYFIPDAIWSRSASLGLGAALSNYTGPLFQIFCTNARMDSRGPYLNTKGMPAKRRLTLLSLFPLHYYSLSIVEKRLLNHCQPVFFSKNMYEQMKRSYGTLVKAAHIIPPGIDREIFHKNKGKQQQAAIAAKYSIETAKKIVLYVGRLSGAKNIYLLLKAFAQLGPDRILLLVGDGPERSRLAQYAKQLNILPRVFFAGWQDELLPGFYSLADVTVLPSTIESFGQSLLESLACGTPVVGFRGDGRRVLTATNEIVKNRVTGRVVENVSPSALAAGIEEILKLPAQDYRVMAQNAIRDVRLRFDWEHFVDRMVDLSQQRIHACESKN